MRKAISGAGTAVSKMRYVLFSSAALPFVDAAMRPRISYITCGL